MYFSRTAYESTLLSLREMEAARVRTAQIPGCMICTQVRAARDFNTQLSERDAAFKRAMRSRGPDPDAACYAAIDRWRSSSSFTDRERLVMEYAELMGERPQAFAADEAFWRRVHDQFDDEELVDLTLSIASWIAMGRVLHTLGLDTVCMPMRAAV
jgi:alkylhydroperoxidase family enzyme